MSRPFTRRSFVAGTVVAASAAGCIDLIPQNDDPTTDDPTTDGTDTGQTTRPTNPVLGGGADGNVQRDYVLVNGVLVAVAWRHPRGHALLQVQGQALVLTTAQSGTRTIDADQVDVGVARQRIVGALGESTWAEARAAMRQLAAG